MQGASLNLGDIVKGKVKKVLPKSILVDIGYKSLGIVPISELSNFYVADINEICKEGDEINLKVISLDEKKVILSKKEVENEEHWKKLFNALEKKQSVKGKVIDVVKGGLIVDVGLKGFLPASLLEDFFVKDLHKYVNKELELEVVSIDKEKNQIILSNKSKLVDKKKTKLSPKNIKKDKYFDKDLVSKIKVGDVIEGVVKGITNFGVFVDIGGIDGLVHISEISFSRSVDPNTLLAIGDKVKVKVLTIDKIKKRITLSIKQTKKSPWQEIDKYFKVGQIVSGKVTSLAPFGAFVKLSEGIDGLIHISRLSSKKVSKVEDVVKVGQQVKVKILDILPAKEKISLSLKDVDSRSSSNEVSMIKKKKEDLKLKKEKTEEKTKLQKVSTNNSKENVEEEKVSDLFSVKIEELFPELKKLI